MSERSEEFIKKIWDKRNESADTEEKLVSEILRLISDSIQCYSAQGGKIVLDQEDLLKLAEELDS